MSKQNISMRVKLINCHLQNIILIHPNNCNVVVSFSFGIIRVCVWSVGLMEFQTHF